VKEYFLDRFRQHKDYLFSHFTCATDSSNIQVGVDSGALDRHTKHRTVGCVAYLQGRRLHCWPNPPPRPRTRPLLACFLQFVFESVKTIVLNNHLQEYHLA